MKVFRKATKIGLALALTANSGCSDARPTPPDKPMSLFSETKAKASLSGTFLHLSDIHFDVFASGMDKRVRNLPVDQWQSEFEKHASSEPSSGHEDTNYALLKSALDAASASGTYDFIVYTGDYMPHDYSWKTSGLSVQEQADFAANIVEFVNLMIANEFPGKKLIGALGNNDSGCGDYNLVPRGDFLSDLAPKMPGLASDPSAKTDFQTGGYYVTSHPTVPGTDFIVLSPFWSNSYTSHSHSPCLLPPVDQPGDAQAEWLKSRLEVDLPASSGGASSGRKVVLVMHIAPGMDGHSANPQWRSRFETTFEELPANLRDRFVSAFAGHSHMDEFRVLADGTAPYLAVRLGPAVTSYNSNAPAFSTVTYDQTDGSTQDYTVFSYRDDSAAAVYPKPLKWQKEYSFSDAYGLPNYDPENLQTLAAKLQMPSSERNSYLRYYRAKDQPNLPGTWKQVVCATSETQPAAFLRCIDNMHASR